MRILDTERMKRDWVNAHLVYEDGTPVTERAWHFGDEPTPEPTTKWVRYFNGEFELDTFGLTVTRGLKTRESIRDDIAKLIGGVHDMDDEEFVEFYTEIVFLKRNKISAEEWILKALHANVESGTIRAVARDIAALRRARGGGEHWS